MTPALIAAGSSSGGSSTALLVSLVLMVAVFYFLLIRPQQRRARSQRELVSELGVGDEVVTVGGMFGTIRAVDDEAVSVIACPVDYGENARLVERLGALEGPI